MNAPTKLELAINAFRAVDLQVFGSTECTSQADASVDLGRGVTVQIARSGLMSIVVIHDDGKMSFDLEGTYSFHAIIKKAQAALQA